MRNRKNETLGILAIDPGTEQSGVVEYRDGRIERAEIVQNRKLIEALNFAPELRDCRLVIERIASYGMAVGRTTFDTVMWVGRFIEAWHDDDKCILIERRDVKLHLCGQTRAKDSNIRQAVIDKLGPPGKKADPGPTYGVKSHCWQALALAITAAETTAGEAPPA